MTVTDRDWTLVTVTVTVTEFTKDVVTITAVTVKTVTHGGHAGVWSERKLLIPLFKLSLE